MSKEQIQQQTNSPDDSSFTKIAYSQSEDIFNLMSTTPKPISGNLRLISLNIVQQILLILIFNFIGRTQTATASSSSKSPTLTGSPRTSFKPYDADECTQCEKCRNEVILKQGRQLKVIYELQKVMFDKLERIETQMRKEQDKKIDLSGKVWTVSIYSFNYLIYIVEYH